MARRKEYPAVSGERRQSSTAVVDPQPGRRLGPRMGLPLVVVAAVIYQFWVISSFSDSVFFGNPILDARYQIEWAFELSRGNDPHPVFFQAPLFSYLVALWIGLFGWHVPGLVLAQWVLLQGAFVLFYRTLCHFKIRRSIRLLALSFAVFYPLFPFYAATLHKTALEIFFHALVLFAGVKLAGTDAGKRQWWMAALFGLSCGLGTLVRATFQAFPIMMALIMRGPRTIPTVWMMSGFLLPYLWAMSHNYMSSGEIGSITSNFGYTLYLANNPGNLAGVELIAEGISNDPMQEEASSREFAEKAEGRSLSENEVNAFFVARVLEYVRNQPGVFFGALRNRIYWYFHREELPDNECYTCLKQDILPLGVNPLHWGWVVLLLFPALCVQVHGLWGLWRRAGVQPRDQIFLLSYAIGLFSTLMIFYVSSRLRIGHVLVWMTVLSLATHTAVNLWSERKQKRRGWVIAAVFAFLPGLFFLAQPPLGYNPDLYTLRLCWFHIDLGNFNEARQIARTRFKDPDKRKGVSRIITKLQSQPEPEKRSMYLLSSIIPHRR